MVATDGAPSRGKADARVTIVEFTDYQCPFCSRYVRETYPQLDKEYVQTGKVKYVLRDLPLEAIHPLAMKAAEAAHCAGEQGKYWEMHDRLFANQTELARTDLAKHAQALGLDAAASTSAWIRARRAPACARTSPRPGRFRPTAPRPPSRA